MRIVPFLWLLLFMAAAPAADLPTDKVGTVKTLPQPYPRQWVWVQDIAFEHMSEGRVILMDPRGTDPQHQYMGMINAANVAAFAQSSTRPEIYVAETFYDRINHGTRSDVVTIHDKVNLKPIGEVALGPKRANVMPGRYALHLTQDESLLLVYFFTPGMSIGVIDVTKRKLVNEVPLPGCALAYPTGKRGFSSLCGNGSMISFQLDAAGKVTATKTLDPFFDVDRDALFEKPVIVNGIGYFPTFLGNMQEIDLHGDTAVPGSKWSLVPEADKAQNWRPGGAMLLADDSAGRLYILMHPDGKEGTHKDGGPEVWVYDAKKHERVQRVPLKTWGVSVEVTRGPDPMLLVTNAEMAIDVYDAKTGKLARTLDHFGQETPVMLHTAR